MTQRFQRHPSLALFDGPGTNTSTARRRTSTVPLQALFLMNNPFVRQQAEGLARRLIGSSGDLRERIQLAYRLGWSRAAESGEVERALRYVQQYQNELAKVGVPAKR